MNNKAKYLKSKKNKDSIKKIINIQISSVSR